NMEATFSVKKSSGYSGNLCTHGSFECVKFYLDFHDGAGFIDQGSVKVNVHDIPAEKDCNGNSIFPIIYVATLKKKSIKISFCDKPLLPTLRAILSWNYCPPPDSPDWKPVWGSIMDCDIQIKPFIKPIFPDYIDFSKYLELANSSPALTVKQVAEISGVDLNQLNPQPQPPGIAELAKNYEKLKIPASRFAFKMVNDIISDPTSESALANKSILEGLKIDVNSIIDQLSVIQLPDPTKTNVDYEELECVGLDYNTESLVATICIKKNVGYSGDLCQPGSTEYIAFWIDWGNDCKWEYINTVELNVHDIKMKGDCLCYSVSLPLDATFHRKLCENPNVIRVRGVLSWNYPPSTTDPIDLEFYGNRVDAHIQLKPGKVLDPNNPIAIFDIIGGIDINHVDDITGLTKPGSFFAYNGITVPTGAPFDGVIVLNGPSFPGYRYKIKITNLSAGTPPTDVTDPFTVVGDLPFWPWVQYTPQVVDAQGYYPFLDHAKNTLNVLARFSPPTEDLYRVDLEVDTIPGSFFKIIQMDKTDPDVRLQVNDGGDCTNFKIGDTITGHFFVYDLNISEWSFGSTWGGGASGTSNTPPLPGTPFSIVTPANAHPCGEISLWARDKTIINSQGVGHFKPDSYKICLQEKNKQ
ncbi:MAG TPA: hypothetical protein VJY62_09890, partial [Bacteroidia bacterium]|nr:hypothetical protein [Bacteroidia bacterium]